MAFQSTLIRHWHILVTATALMILISLTYLSSNAPFDVLSLNKRSYPVEAAILTYFPEVKIRVPTIPWWIARWLRPSWSEWMGPPAACDNQPLPFPILRRMVADSLGISDSDHMFDAGISISKPILLLPTNHIITGKPMCVRAIVPPFISPPKHIKDDPYRYLYAPFEKQDLEFTAPWWDAIVVSADNQETGSSIPLRMRPWSGHRLLRDARRLVILDNNTPEWSCRMNERMFERRLWHIYESDVVFHDNGRYRIEGQLEYMEARWNFEKGPITPYESQRMEVHPQDVLDVTRAHRNSYDEKTAMALPLCTRADHPGRWLPAVNGTGRSDKRGMVWSPYTCRYRTIPYDTFNRCLARKYPRGIDIYGDSNMRRSLKKFITQGKWCNHEDNFSTDRRACFCEDFNEATWDTALFNTSARINNLTFGAVPRKLSSDTSSYRQSQGVRVRSYKWDGLTFLNEPKWQQAIRTASVDIVIISLGNWDAAYMSMEEFSVALTELVELVKQNYIYPNNHKPPRVVYRTPQYYCCRVDHTDRHRHTSGARIQAFDQLARGVFVKHFKAIIWDTVMLGEARTWDEKLESRKCPANHASADVVEIENQLLMNALCNE
ncbi:hypothetical protein EC973_006288 [Apophysomyces ossiformis]|uniref:Uncharacterized protein n=1 Tax=Apophysomyces ossiformis TaxID=679940 RepID=A0A8H7ERR8_9FUNG|nr:hypothetical protein EC973_006288 [Apophysomyces ossiformis]